MPGVDTRYIVRESMYLVADVRLAGEDAAYRVKVRNLSAGGMMAEGNMPVQPGARLVVELRSLPPVEASVAWVSEGRFGIAFAEEIDPRASRIPVGKGATSAPRHVRPAGIAPPGMDVDPARVRPI